MLTNVVVLQAIEREEAMKKSNPKESAKPKETTPEPTKMAALPEQKTEQKPAKSASFGNFF